jgi:hypothetical protein
MIPNNLKHINNITRRFQDYDKAGTKYAFDIHYTTVHSPGEYAKAKRLHGADIFEQNINDLLENYDDVATVTISDYCGKAANSHRMNPPVIIRLTNGATEEQEVQPSEREKASVGQEKPVQDVLQGLSGLFSGTEFAGYGNLAPIAKFIDDKHVIDRLREKCDEQSERLMVSERKNAELSAKYQSLSNDYEHLQEEADKMDEELEQYRNRQQKSDGVMNMIGLAGASIAKTFLRQNPSILSGIIPVEQLSGILSEDTDAAKPVTDNDLSKGDRERMDKSTSMFEWIQALEEPLFDEVYSILSVIRRQPEYAAHIINVLSGKSKG